MANISMNATKLLAYLNDMEDCPERNIMVAGKHGIGKSQICTEYHLAKGRKVQTLFLGQMSDPGDLIGLPTLVESVVEKMVYNEKTGKKERVQVKTQRTSFASLEWFPTDDEPIVLFLDELNRARPEILQVIMDLALSKKLNGRSLPKGSRIISAINSGSEYNVTDLDPALLSRFALVEFDPTPEEWLEWARKNKLDDRVIGFINDHKDMLDGKGENSSGLNKTPDRRAWADVGKLLKGKENVTLGLIDAVASMVGISAAAGLNTWLKEDHLPKPSDVLNNFDKVKKQMRNLSLHEIAKLSEEVLIYISGMNKLPDEIKTGFNSYVKWVYDLAKKGVEGVNKSMDAFHHLQTNMMLPKYNSVMDVILIDKLCPDVFKLMQESMA